MQKTYIKYVYGAVLSHVISAVTLCPTLSEKKKSSRYVRIYKTGKRNLSRFVGCKISNSVKEACQKVDDSRRLCSLGKVVTTQTSDFGRFGRLSYH